MRIVLNSRRWNEQKPNTPDFFYDEPIKDANKRPREYPLDDVDLIDAWVVAIVNSKVSRDERAKKIVVKRTAKSMDSLNKEVFEAPKTISWVTSFYWERNSKIYLTLAWQ